MSDDLAKFDLELVSGIGCEYYTKEYTQIKARNLKAANLERIAVAKVR